VTYKDIFIRSVSHAGNWQLITRDPLLAAGYK